jgi:hypothetical protein
MIMEFQLLDITPENYIKFISKSELCRFTLKLPRKLKKKLYGTRRKRKKLEKGINKLALDLASYWNDPCDIDEAAEKLKNALRSEIGMLKKLNVTGLYNETKND